MGFTFVYNDGTQVNVGYSGTQSASLDLTGSKKLYSFKSYCDTLICERFQICSIDYLSFQITCITVGNNSALYNTDISLQSLHVNSFFGTFNALNGNNYISNLAITFSLLSQSEDNTLNLVKEGTSTPVSNFNQSLNQINSILISSNSVCVTGFTFIFKNGTNSSAGFNSSNSILLDLSEDKKLYSISSNCGTFCNSIRLCSIDTGLSTIDCVRAGNPSFDPNNFAMVQDFAINTIYGDFISSGSDNCLQNLGTSYSLSSSSLTSNNQIYLNYIGCYGDVFNSNVRDLNGFGNAPNLFGGTSITSCVNLCTYLNFKYSGNEAGYVFTTMFIF